MLCYLQKLLVSWRACSPVIYESLRLDVSKNYLRFFIRIHKVGHFLEIILLGGTLPALDLLYLNILYVLARPVYPRAQKLADRI